MVEQADGLGGVAAPRRAPIWYVLAGIVVLIVFMGGMVFGLILPKGNLVDRALHRIAGLGRELSAAKSGPTRSVPAEYIETGLAPLEIFRLPIGRFAGGGGAMAVIGDAILVATPKGKLALVTRGSGGQAYSLRLLDAAVPMNYAGLGTSAFASDPQFNTAYFRTLGMLPVRQADGQLGLYVSHHRFAGNCIQFVVSRAGVTEGPGGPSVDASSWEDVFVAEPCIPMKATGHPFAGHESGGRLARTSGNTLLVTIGDFEFDGVNGPGKASMDPASHLGKVIEINLDTRAASIFARGFRNPQGLVVSRDGLVWETEHGPHGGDELNLLQRGRNYGWPEVSYGVDYGFPSRPWPANQVQGRHDGYTAPIFAFLPSIGISNLAEADAAEFPLWAGDLLVASLKDSSLWRLRREGERIVYSERIHLGERLRDIQSLPDGQLAVLTDNLNLIIIRHRVTSAGAPAPTIALGGLDQSEKLMRNESSSDPVEGTGPGFGRELFKSRCAGCHAGAGQANVGPPLRGVVGRKIGSVRGFPYSSALAAADGTWTRQRLLAFLSEPGTAFPGTAMPEVILPYRSYDSIVAYLEEAD